MARSQYLKTVVALIILAVFAAPAWAQAQDYRHDFTIYDDNQGNALSGPAGVACGSDRIVVSDSGNSRILIYAAVGDEVKPGGEIKLVRQVRPTTMQIAGESSLLVYDSRAKEILRYDFDGKESGKVQPGNVPAGRMIIKSFRVDDSGNIYLLDVFGGRVVVLDKSSAFIRQITFPEEFGFFSDLAVGRDGSVFIVDSVRSQVFAAGTGAEVFAPLSGQMKEVLPYPTHIETDSQGLLYIVDEESGSVALLRKDGSLMGKMFNRGRKEGLLYYPAQLCVSGDGRIFIADRDNNRVQVFKEKE